MKAIATIIRMVNTVTLHAGPLFAAVLAVRDEMKWAVMILAAWACIASMVMRKAAK